MGGCPNTPANRAAFGCAGTKTKKGYGEAPFPQIQTVLVTARAGRAKLGAIMGRARAGEQKLLARLIARRPGLFAGRVFCFDRNFPGHKIITAILGAGGHVVARIKAGISLPVTADGWLPDKATITGAGTARPGRFCAGAKTQTAVQAHGGHQETVTGIPEITRFAPDSTVASVGAVPGTARCRGSRGTGQARCCCRSWVRAGSEIGYLAGRGLARPGRGSVTGRARRGQSRHSGVRFACADVTRLPLLSGVADLLLDRGCFHYLGAPARARYAQEAGRVLHAGGRLLLWMCLTSAGVPNGLDEPAIRSAFCAWQLASIERVDLLSDTRTMPAVLAILVRPASATG